MLFRQNDPETTHLALEGELKVSKYIIYIYIYHQSQLKALKLTLLISVGFSISHRPHTVSKFLYQIVLTQRFEEQYSFYISVGFIMPSFSHFETQKAPRLCYFSRSQFQIFLHIARYWNTGVSKALIFQHISVSQRLRKKITKYVCVFQYHVSLRNETQESQRRWSFSTFRDQSCPYSFRHEKHQDFALSQSSSEDGPHTLRQEP